MKITHFLYKTITYQSKNINDLYNDLNEFFLKEFKHGLLESDFNNVLQELCKNDSNLILKDKILRYDI
jgi:hypothetical protein